MPVLDQVDGHEATAAGKSDRYFVVIAVHGGYTVIVLYITWFKVSVFLCAICCLYVDFAAVTVLYVVYHIFLAELYFELEMHLSAVFSNYCSCLEGIV